MTTLQNCAFWAADRFPDGKYRVKQVNFWIYPEHILLRTCTFQSFYHDNKPLVAIVTSAENSAEVASTGASACQGFRAGQEGQLFVLSGLPGDVLSPR